jgi:hypothetical protein
MDGLENQEMIDSSNTKKYSYYKKKKLLGSNTTPATG